MAPLDFSSKVEWPQEKRSARTPTTARSDATEFSKSKGLTMYVTPMLIFLVVGSAVLLLLALVPLWNAVTLLQDSNYVYWAGRGVPQMMITVCVGIIFIYMVTVMFFFSKSSVPKPEAAVMMVVQVFILLFGLALMFASVPLTHQAQVTYTDLMYNCDHSDQTHRLYEYSAVLQNIRQTPECAKMHSVEECKGYQEVAPYTTMLKGMENNFRCAGFCYSPPDAAPKIYQSPPDFTADYASQAARAFSTQVVVSSASSAPAPGPMAGAAGPGYAPAPGSAPAAASLIGMIRRDKQKFRLRRKSLPPSSSLRTDENWKGASAEDFYHTAVYPPTLFSDRNFQASCDGMAARDMKNFAGSIAQQTFAHGLYFVFVAVMTGFLRLLTFCMPRGGKSEPEAASRRSTEEALA